MCTFLCFVDSNVELVKRKVSLVSKQKNYIEGIHNTMVWLLPQVNTNYDDYTLQLDGAPPHFHRYVRVLLNRVLQQRGSDMLQKETTTFSTGHPVRRI